MDWGEWISVGFGALVTLWFAALLVVGLLKLAVATPKAVRGFWLQLASTRKQRVLFALVLAAWLSVGAWAWTGALGSAVEADRINRENADDVQRTCLDLLR